MGNLRFGRLVQILRRQQQYWDMREKARPWSQTVLGEQTNLSKRQIAKIEQGQVENLKRYLPQLAQAFSLTEVEKVGFYAEAGYVYTPAEQAINIEAIRLLLENLPFPATARTPLWDFVVVNAYHRILRGMNDEFIQLMQEQEMGPNLLWVLFGEEFKQWNITHRERNWAAEAVWAFRATSFRYTTSQRYQFLLQNLYQIPAFKRAWRASEVLPPFGGNTDGRRRPIYRIDHPEFGTMEFLSLRLPNRYYGELDIAVYPPIGDSVARYEAFRQQVGQRMATVFPLRPFTT